ncbi:MAG TPA: branched-chain amino acid ABC transporter permease [Streptosporangiaceae bacterium]|nr:branched-chain amino acid ABC transporter permease [Streptosporangiaceae bacterium]
MIDRLTDRRTERGARPLRPLWRHVLGAVILAVILLALINVSSTFRDYQIAEVAVYVVAVAGLTFLIGLSGQISIGNGAFMAVGAYVAALLIIHLNWPLPVVFLVAAAATALVGGILGVAAARLRGPYLAGTTLIFAVALPSLANRYVGLLGGDQGLSVNITVPSGLGTTFPLTRWQAWITCATAIVTLVLLANLASSRIGRSWRAVRDDEVAAALAGLNVGRLRVLAFVVSAATAGLGGALLAITTGLVAPTSFTLALSIGLLTAAVVGGLGSLAGAVWGSLVLVFLPTYATDVATSHGLSSSAGSNIPIVVYGVALIAVMLAFPNGIQGGVRQLGAFLMGTRRSSAHSPRNPPATGFPDGSATAREHQEEGPR